VNFWKVKTNQYKMQIAKKILTHFPNLEFLLMSMYNRFQRIPPISYSSISKELLRDCIGREDPTILEIGSNDGSSTLWFFEVFEAPKVYCFEPDPRAIRRFNSKVGNHTNIKLFEIALSDRNGEIEFHQSSGHTKNKKVNTKPNGWDLSGSIRQPKDHLIRHPWVKFEKKIKVQTSTLDTWCNINGISNIDFIWMDVQGAEIDVFRGGKNSINKTRFIYTEYSNQELYKGQFNLKKLIEFLRNFEIVIRYPNDVLFRNKN